MRKSVISWLYPDAHDTAGNEGKSLDAYFDHDKKKWVFPGEAEVSDPAAAPPPMARADSDSSFSLYDQPPGGSGGANPTMQKQQSQQQLNSMGSGSGMGMSPPDHLAPPGASVPGGGFGEVGNGNGTGNGTGTGRTPPAPAAAAEEPYDPLACLMAPPPVSRGASFASLGSGGSSNPNLPPLGRTPSGQLTVLAGAPPSTTQKGASPSDPDRGAAARLSPPAPAGINVWRPPPAPAAAPAPEESAEGSAEGSSSSVVPTGDGVMQEISLQ